MQWVVQGLLGGGALATAMICWVNSLMAVRGKGEVVQNWWVFKWEAYVLASPFILIAMGFVVLVKGPEACRKLKVFQTLREWRDKKSPCPTMEGLRKWRQGLAKRTWWGKKNKRDKGGNSASGSDFDLERGESPAQHGKKDEMNSSESVSSTAPPPYVSNDPLN